MDYMYQVFFFCVSITTEKTLIIRKVGTGIVCYLPEKYGIRLKPGLGLGFGLDVVLDYA